MSKYNNYCLSNDVLINKRLSTLSMAGRNDHMDGFVHINQLHGNGSICICQQNYYHKIQ
jgi:hypothetical protein